jgi:MFS family permease
VLSLIAWRAVLGVCAALVFPATLSLISMIFTGSRHHSLAVGLWTATAGLGIALGPIVGGVLLRHFEWPSLFWINVAIVVPVVAALWPLVPEGRAQQRGRFDVVGAALVIAAVTLLVGTIIEGPRLGWLSWQVVTGFFLAAAATWAFLAWERRTTAPLLDLKLFRDHRVAASSAAIALAFFALFGFTFAITMYFQAVLGYSALGAGLAILPFAVVMGACSPLAALAAQRFGGRICVSSGLALMGAGFGIVTLATATTSYWGVMVPAMVLMATGLAFVQGPSTDVIMAAAPRDSVGVISAVNDSIREVGGTIGVAVLGSILAHRYEGGMAVMAASDPALEAASDSIMAAQQVAASLPTSPLREELLATATNSFLGALHTNCWLLAILGGLSAIAVWFAFSRRPRDPSEITRHGAQRQVSE